MKTLRLYLAWFLSLAATAAIAADKLPLRHGIYVDSRIDCKEFSNVSMMSFWGDQLNVAQMIGHIVKVSKSGRDYRVEIDGEPVRGDGPTETFTWTVTIYGETDMKVQSEFSTDRYRWCFDEVPR